MKLEHHTPKKRDIDLIMLIDVVFLLLIFFLVAATTRPFQARGIKPAQTMKVDEGGYIKGPLFVDPKGQLRIGERLIEDSEREKMMRAKAVQLAGKTLHIVADRTLEAVKLVDVLELAKSMGIKKIRLVTERRPR